MEGRPDRLVPTLTPATWKRSAVAAGAGRLGDPRFERQLLLEVGRLAVLEGDVLALEQLDEDLDEAGVELLAGDPAQLLRSPRSSTSACGRSRAAVITS